VLTVTVDWPSSDDSGVCRVLRFCGRRSMGLIIIFRHRPGITSTTVFLKSRKTRPWNGVTLSIMAQYVMRERVRPGDKFDLVVISKVLGFQQFDLLITIRSASRQCRLHCSELGNYSNCKGEIERRWICHQWGCMKSGFEEPTSCTFCSHTVQWSHNDVLYEWTQHG